MRGGCPRCGTTIPFDRYLLSRGRPFDCKNCKANIRIPRSSFRAALRYSALLAGLSRILPPWAMPVIMVIILLLDWLRSKVVTVENPLLSADTAGV